MKKNILLILTSCFALTGCELNLDFLSFGKQENTTIQNKQSKEDENQKNTENTVDNEENNNNNTPPVDPVNPVDPVDQIGQYTVTIPFCGSEFSEITSGQAGYVFADHPDDLQNYCASKLDATNMLKSISFENLNTAKYKNELYLSVGTGYYANDRFKEGLFKWTSLLPLHKVVIKAKAYSKLDDGGATDIQSVVWIDNTSCSLACASDADPVSKTLSVDYEDGTQTFSIKSTGSRVMLESLTITWSYIYGAE